MDHDVELREEDVRGSSSGDLSTSERAARLDYCTTTKTALLKLSPLALLEP